MAEHFRIAQVTPFAWEEENSVNEYVRELSKGLAGRGHEVFIIAPSTSQTAISRSRKIIRALAEGEPVDSAKGGAPTVLAIGELVSVPFGRRSRSLPVDISRTIEELLTNVEFDFVHVHDPFAPSASSAALRHSRALNIGTFHSPTERILSTQLARKVVELFLGRLDVRTASFKATENLMNSFFPAEYRIVTPGVNANTPKPHKSAKRILFIDAEERTAVRTFLRGLRGLSLEDEWTATIFVPDGDRPLRNIPKAFSNRVEFVSGQERPLDRVLVDSDICVLASNGTRAAPEIALKAIASGAVPIASRIPLYDEIFREGELGLLFEPDETETLAAQIARVLSDDELFQNKLEADLATRQFLSWPRVTDDFEAIYREVAARRHAHTTPTAVTTRLGKRELIDVDLHMHTDHSHDCATPVEVLLATAKQQGLGAIAVTDHNEISGAVEAAAKAEGIKIIVGEEVKTADQGEVIGLFIQEKIPRGLSLEETIAEIKRQGGVVYVPHPFDRMHSVPDYDNLLRVIADIDAIEIFNPRVAIASFNEEAVRFAAKYGITAGAGSDSHVPQGLGSVRIRMRDFDGPEEFLHSLREADIIRKPSSLLYVQALKFLQTKATPAPARAAARKRKVRKAVQK